MDSEHGCVTSTDSSRDFCQLSAKSVDLQFIRCHHTDYILIMSTWSHESALLISQSGLRCVCVCCHGRCIHLCTMVSAHDLVRVSAPPHVTADVARSLGGISGAAPSTDLQRRVEDSASSLIKDGAPPWQITRLLPYSKITLPVYL